MLRRDELARDGDSPGVSRVGAVKDGGSVGEP